MHVRRALSVGRVLGGVRSLWGGVVGWPGPSMAAARGAGSSPGPLAGLGALSFCLASDGAMGSGKLAAWSLRSFPAGPLGVLLVMLFLWSILCRLVATRGFVFPQRHAAAARGLWPQRVHWGQLLLQL